MASNFLKAEWRKLLMFNYAVDADLLTRYLPAGTEIDLWNNTCYISLVGFMFLNTKLKGIKVPFHSNFEEVNLRFYVRYGKPGTWKRGVVFIKEIVPRPALTMVANKIYKENYQTNAMSHKWDTDGEELRVEYCWKNKKNWNYFKASAQSTPIDILEGSEEEFITEHYWGYTRLSATKTSEYEVRHPRWQVYEITDHNVDTDFGSVYGKDFDFLTTAKPVSVFLAEGSEIEVMQGKIIL